MAGADMMPDMNTAQAEGIFDSWHRNAIDAITEMAGDFDMLREHCIFASGALFGQLVALGLEEIAARQYVERLFASIQSDFNERYRDARAAKRVVN
jgi:hypothetical protein